MNELITDKQTARKKEEKKRRKKEFIYFALID